MGSDRRIRQALLSAVAVAVAAGAAATVLGGAFGTTSRRTVAVTRDFARADHGWTGGFADYPLVREQDWEMATDRRAQPQYVRRGSQALFVHGVNGSDDLFLFVKGRIDDLDPGAAYRVRVDVLLASDAPLDAIGVGGSPGLGVTIKAGATTVEPRGIDVDGYVMMNVDKGNQATGGADAVVLGHAGVRVPADRRRFRLKHLPWGRRPPLEVSADPTGAIWLLVGADSGFEGVHDLYFAKVRVRATRLPGERR